MPSAIKPSVVVTPSPLVSKLAKGATNEGTAAAPEFQFSVADEVNWYDTKTDLICTFYDLFAKVKNAGNQTRLIFGGQMKLPPNPKLPNLYAIYNPSPDVMLTLYDAQDQPLPDLVHNVILNKDFHFKFNVTFPNITSGSQGLDAKEFTRPVKLDVVAAVSYVSCEFKQSGKFNYG